MDKMAPKFACFLCQEYTEHQTKNCPNLKCKKCGHLGHARKDCQSISTSESRSPSETETYPGNRNESQTENNEENIDETFNEKDCQPEKTLNKCESQSNDSDTEEGEIDNCDEICEICNSGHVLEVTNLKDKPFNRCIKYIGRGKKREKISFLRCAKL